MDSVVLKKIQSIETEILGLLHTFCIDNGIEYSLMFGTLLGAVRHHGPIPWDDDADVIMTRENYDRFILTFCSKPIEGLYLQKEGPYCNSRINHLKLRKNGTILGNEFTIKFEEHSGIWVDIFVFDKLPRNYCKRKKILFWNAIRMIYTREYPYRGKNIFLTFVSKLLLSFPKKIKIKLRIIGEKKIKYYNKLNKNYDLVCFASPEEMTFTYPPKSMDSFVEMDYQNSKLMVSSLYDSILKIRYGNYLQYPPESERVCLHNPTIVKF